jgi:hypothetical protein
MIPEKMTTKTIPTARNIAQRGQRVLARGARPEKSLTACHPVDNGPSDFPELLMRTGRRSREGTRSCGGVARRSPIYDPRKIRVNGSGRRFGKSGHKKAEPGEGLR